MTQQQPPLVVEDQRERTEPDPPPGVAIGIALLAAANHCHGHRRIMSAAPSTLPGSWDRTGTAARRPPSGTGTIAAILTHQQRRRQPADNVDTGSTPASDPLAAPPDTPGVRTCASLDKASARDDGRSHPSRLWTTPLYDQTRKGVVVGEPSSDRTLACNRFFSGSVTGTAFVLV
jgi:hypothetical protein